MSVNVNLISRPLNIRQRDTKLFGEIMKSKNAEILFFLWIYKWNQDSKCKDDGKLLRLSSCISLDK